MTFSQAQQTQVEDLLEQVRRTSPEVDAFFAEELSEPVFVKNLENVEGDERDVILFSICYGPDALGRIALNFGPMNREGGERRLNVAITRARREVLVFSTLRADQIDLARTRARGVHDLKKFLDYAERGPLALAEATQYDPEADFESPFEKAVYDSLVDKGWEVICRWDVRAIGPTWRWSILTHRDAIWSASSATGRTTIERRLPATETN